jgi:hypothetical protein
VLNRRQAGILPACLRLLFRLLSYPLRPGVPTALRPSHLLRCNEGVGFAEAGIETEAAMARTRYAPDRGLIARMGATIDEVRELLTDGGLIPG